MPTVVMHLLNITAATNNNIVIFTHKLVKNGKYKQYLPFFSPNNVYTKEFEVL